MQRNKYIIIVLVWIVCHTLTACSNHATDNSLTDKITADSPSTMQKVELTKIYTQAIAEFIKAVYKKDKTTFDTLFFGRHVYGQPDDFPDIELPETIEKTHVMLITPEAGQKKQQESRSLVYINMMGWVEKDKAEFSFVVFSNGAEHQYDYFINLTYNPSENKFELTKIEFENYLHLNGQNPKRITIY